MADAKTITRDELVNIVRARVSEAPSLRQLAPKLDASPATLSMLLTNGKMKPGPRLLRALGYKAVTLYRKVTR